MLSKFSITSWLIVTTIGVVGGIVLFEHLGLKNFDPLSALTNDLVTSNWQTFSDPRLEMEFKYPRTISDGSLVEAITSEYEHELQIFVHAGKKIYFDICYIPNTSTGDRYEMIKETGKVRPDDFYISEPEEVIIDGQQAIKFDVNSRGEEGTVIFIQKDSDVYQIIFDPRLPLNSLVLSTIKFL